MASCCRAGTFRIQLDKQREARWVPIHLCSLESKSLQTLQVFTECSGFQTEHSISVVTKKAWKQWKRAQYTRFICPEPQSTQCQSHAVVLFPLICAKVCAKRAELFASLCETKLLIWWKPNWRSHTYFCSLDFSSGYKPNICLAFQCRN